MKYIGCDFNPGFQVIAMLDKETRELVERRLLHTAEARVFCDGWQGPAVAGSEASGNTHGVAMRRGALLEMLQGWQEKLGPLDQAVEKEASACPAARRFGTHPGVGPVISLATVLTMGDVKRFADSRSWVSYLGLNPSEESSGQRRRLRAISKQGNPFLRYLLVEGAASAVRRDKSLARLDVRLKAKKHHGVAKLAVARQLTRGYA